MGSSVRNILTIAGKEFRSYYSSPIAWVLLGLFAAIFGYFFSVQLAYSPAPRWPASSAAVRRR
jgi:ABC-type transport system involved in multi-copper enzyme maturation permease subunit